MSQAKETTGGSESISPAGKSNTIGGEVNGDGSGQCPMPLLKSFGSLIGQLEAKHATDQYEWQYTHRLKFVKHSMQSYEDIEDNLADYLQLYVDSAQQYATLMDSIRPLTGESRICELLIALIRTIETQLDQQVDLFDQVIEVVSSLATLAHRHPSDQQFTVDAVVKCSLLVYDSFVVLRSMRHKVVEIASLYHVPYFYDTDTDSVRVRGSLLTTYKNICLIMTDFGILSEALWYVRTVTDDETSEVKSVVDTAAIAHSATDAPITHSATSTPKSTLVA